MTAHEIKSLLRASESKNVERRPTLDRNEVGKILVAFANDLEGRHKGWLILGQAPGLDVVGLKGDSESLQQVVVDIARDSCTPAIPISVSSYVSDGKLVLVVEIRRGLARPHFWGPSYVRIGSEIRKATDAEIILMRTTGEGRKYSILKEAFDERKFFVTLTWPTDGPGSSSSSELAEMLDVTPNFVTLESCQGSGGVSLSYAQFELGFDTKANHLEIRRLKSAE